MLKLKFGNLTIDLKPIILLLMFLSILMGYVLNTGYKLTGYYVMMGICAAIGIASSVGNNKLPRGIFYFAIILAISTLVNMLVVGNVNIGKFLEVSLLNTFAAIMIYKMKNASKALLASLVVFFLFFAYHFIVFGINTRVIAEYSNNFVSVIMLIPGTLCYILIEKENKKITIVPALLIWVICLLSRGRTGIICSSVLFLFVFIYSGRENLETNYNNSSFFRNLKKIIILLLIIIIAYHLGNTFYENITGKFQTNGMDNSARLVLWNDYINKTTSSLKNIFCGTPFKNTLIGTIQHGNSHNSFLTIHAYSGLISFIVVVFLTIKSLVLAVKDKKWCFFVCSLVFCIRASFDYMFWGTRGSIVFYFIILYSFFREGNISALEESIEL